MKRSSYSFFHWIRYRSYPLAQLLYVLHKVTPSLSLMVNGVLSSFLSCDQQWGSQAKIGNTFTSDNVWGLFGVKWSGRWSEGMEVGDGRRTIVNRGIMIISKKFKSRGAMWKILKISFFSKFFFIFLYQFWYFSYIPKYPWHEI